MSVQAIARLPQLRTPGHFPAHGVLFAMEILAIELSLLLGFGLRVTLLRWLPIDLQPDNFRGLSLGVLVVPLVYLLVGLYPGTGMNAAERLKRRVQATAVVFALLLAWDYLIQQHQWSRGILLGTALFAFVLPPLFEELTRRYLARTGRLGVPVIVLGAGHTGRHIVRHLIENPSLGLRVEALLDDDPDKQNTAVLGVPVLGPLAMAAELAPMARTAIVAMPRLHGPEHNRLLRGLPFQQVIVIPDLEGIQSLWVTPRDLGGVLGIELKKNLLHRSNHLIKRTIDLLLTVPLLVLCAPLVAISALLIRLRDPGAVFYHQEREGHAGRPFHMAKLRTMRRNAPRLLDDYLREHPEEHAEWTRHFKLRSDPRIIPGIGPFLRRFSLDELPQLWHVLKGEMSLVGPRPFPQYHLAAFDGDFRELRSSVLPGLTGLWQVAARSDGDLEVQEALDSYYIRNWSPWLDLHILIRTIGVVLLGRGAY
jgi:Undecaprenyl-phosphate galactose phosphotransferase WbaP